MPPPSEKLSSDTLPMAKVHRGDAGELLWWILGGYLLLILLCSFWLRAGGVMAEGQTLNYDRSLFLSVSAATMTGFQQTIGPNDFKPDSFQGPFILILLTVAGSLVAMVVGGLAAVRVLRLPFSDRQTIVGALTVELLAVLAGTAVLYTAHADLTDAVLQSACAFGNSGAVITSKANTILGTRNRFPGFAAWQTQWILLPLSVVGGLGLPVILELYNRTLGGARKLSTHAWTVVKLAAGVYLGATLLLFIDAAFHRHSGAGSIHAAFVAASTTAINCRSAGLPFDLLNDFSRTFQWMIVVLMMIGASPAGTAGGIKVTTFWHLIGAVRNVLDGRPVPRAAGVAAVWLTAYLLLAAFGGLLLSAVAAQVPIDQVGFLTISALSNVGLSRDPVSITGGGLFVLDLIMLAGRLAPMGVLWWLAATTGDAEVLVA